MITAVVLAVAVLVVWLLAATGLALLIGPALRDRDKIR